MAQMKIHYIPATVNPFTAAPLESNVKRRVAGYARVSTDSEEQESSFANQVSYYTDYIKSRDDWTFVTVYTDEGVSATSIAKRDGFNRMVADALAGELDLIVTKSVSRFARNTVDSLSTIRNLKEKGVEVFFEKENTWTFDSKGELMLTIMSSMAQEESRSISENVTWSLRKRSRDGKFSVAYKHFLGYDKGEDGTLVINESQAEIVRLIYSLFIDGLTPHAIAKKLTADKIPTPRGKEVWPISTVQSILTNEKYKGDALLQKTYTENYLTHKLIPNDGKIPQYYIENSHPYIIEPSVFDIVQNEMQKRKNSKHSGVSLFAGRIKCGDCGSYYGAKYWHSTTKYARTIYQCNSKFKTKCTTPHFDENDIERLFVNAVNALLVDNGAVQKYVLYRSALDTSELETERDLALAEAMAAAELVRKCIEENARTALEQSDYAKRYDELAKRHESAKKRYDDCVTRISDKQSRAILLESFIAELKKLNGLLTKFDKRLWCTLVEYVTVYSKDDVRFVFRNGETTQG